MTDVSNLDDLANAISSGSPKIKMYAKAQAAASQSQELDIRKALSDSGGIPGPPGPPGPQGEPGPMGPAGPAGGGGGSSGYHAIVSPGQDVQAIINSAPSGAAIGFQAGTYSVPSGRSVLADLSAKSNLRLVGLAGSGYNSGTGVVFKTSGSNQTLIKDHSLANVKHEASDISYITFVDNSGGGKGIDIFNCDFTRISCCTFNGKLNGGCILLTQYKDGRLASDNAWSQITDCRWRTEGVAILADFAGFRLFGGTITGFPGSGVKLLSNSSARVFGLETALAGQHLLIEGGMSYFQACTFEQYEKATNNVPIIEIVKPANPWPISGNNNTIEGIITPHDSGTPGTCVKIGPGCYTNKLDIVLVAENPNSKISDQGIGTIKEIRG